MSGELIDIVDENNMPTGAKKPRGEIHGVAPAWHRVTHIWIANKNGEILCQLRSRTKDSNPGKWQSFFGGHLKSGQTYEDNALEELREEIGLNVRRKELVPLHVRKSEAAKHFAQIFTLQWGGNLQNLHFDDDEVEQVAWFTPEKLQEAVARGEFCNSIDREVLEYLAQGEYRMRHQPQ